MEKRDFAQRLSELRIQRGLSARDMSLSLGQGESYINNVENCQNYPSMATFFEICEFLEISPQEFFDTANKSPTQAHFVAVTPSRKTRRRGRFGKVYMPPKRDAVKLNGCDYWL